MSTGIHIRGFRPPDEKWQRMRAVWDACMAADVRPPKDVRDYFADEDPDPAGVEVPLSSTTRLEGRWYVDGEKENPEAAVSPYETDWQYGVQIDLSKLPKDLSILRIYES